MEMCPPQQRCCELRIGVRWASREVPGTQEGEKEQMLREEKRQRMELNAVRFSTQNDENVLLVVGMPVASQGSAAAGWVPSTLAFLANMYARTVGS